MAEAIEMPGVNKFESTLLTLFIPSVDRDSKSIDQERWEMAALVLLGKCFGGATAFARGRGVWRDDASGGKLIFDRPIVIHCYTGMEAIRQNHAELHRFLVEMGTEPNQGAVGFVLDRTYMEMPFPLNEGEVSNG